MEQLLVSKLRPKPDFLSLLRFLVAFALTLLIEERYAIFLEAFYF